MLKVSILGYPLEQQIQAAKNMRYIGRPRVHEALKNNRTKDAEFAIYFHDTKEVRICRSLNDMARELGVSYSVLRNRLLDERQPALKTNKGYIQLSTDVDNPTFGEAVILRHGGNMRITVTVEDVNTGEKQVYNSIVACAEALGTSVSTIYHRIKRGSTIDGKRYTRKDYPPSP